ncbi:TetR/AcrR family transcriptional regulator [Novosphingobium sp. Leaf2]|uniref:TetR/AcrR family transcriptional regulator n=1 Tax=Novosphingobium sp. Leaf2 TaxID=1735670 RepID=UPI001F3EF64E|nr:TetR/AcrR family transcriptional regulator [Novosphingobium sp. Leaf2]
MDQARQLFVERGFHQTGMAQIAAASGIAVGQIYRDFANKEAIVAAICEADVAAWLEEESLAVAVERRDGDAIYMWIEQVAMRVPSLEDRRLMCEMVAEVGRNARISEIHRNAERRLHQCLSAAIASLAPDVPQAQRDIVAEFIITLSWGIVTRVELSTNVDPASFRAYVTNLITRELRAIGGDVRGPDQV